MLNIFSKFMTQCQSYYVHVFFQIYYTQCFLWMDVLLMHTDPKMIQVMLDTTYRIAQRYRIKFGTEKSKVLQIGPCHQHSQQYKFTLGPQKVEATDTYKYLRITINTKGDLSDHLKITLNGKTQVSTHTRINLASSNPLKGIQMETIWKLGVCGYIPSIYMLHMITCG